MPFYSGQTNYIEELNKLAPYEKGTFVPVVSGGTTAGVGTYAYQKGKYTKIADTVTFNISLSWTAHTGTGDLVIGILPFIASADANYYIPLTIYNHTITLTASNYMQAFLAPSSSTIAIRQVPVGGGSQATVPIDTSGVILVSGTYFV